jgi:hypothetical protein
LARLPSWPQCCLATPTEGLPCWTRAVSSMTGGNAVVDRLGAADALVGLPDQLVLEWGRGPGRGGQA